MPRKKGVNSVSIGITYERKALGSLVFVDHYCCPCL